MIAPYENNWDYLRAELSCLDLLLGQQVGLSRQADAGAAGEPSRGLFISEREVDRLLGFGQTAGRPVVSRELQRQGAQMHEEVSARRRASLRAGIYLALPHLTHLFALSPFEEKLALICLAPELDTKYARLYGYLHDDLTRSRPTPELAVRLHCTTEQEQLAARFCFSEQATLFRSRLLRYAADEDALWPTRSLRMESRIVGFLLGSAELDGRDVQTVKLITPTEQPPTLHLAESFMTRPLEVARAHLQAAPPASRKLIFHLAGATGTGRKSLAAWLCRELKISLLVVSLKHLLERPQQFEESFQRLMREAVLQPAAVFLDDFDALVNETETSNLRQQLVLRLLEDYSWLTFISTGEAWQAGGLFQRHLLVRLALPVPDIGTRARIWREMPKGERRFAPEVDWDELATKFQLTPGQMEAALIAARNYAHCRAPDDVGAPSSQVTMDDLYRGCRSQSNQKLAALARKLPVAYTWADITLPESSLAQLRELCAQLKHRRTVFETWGFERKLALRKGLAALFFGPTGTGKTMAVEIVARELHLDAYKIDLSSVVSKYIGETEKNLSAIFAEAETSNAILFFDEADALFGKRSEVKDAHDRYANIEINYLLQRIEAFGGVVILATNLRKNIDEAFFRRMSFAVEFPAPEAADRFRIWKQHFPTGAPVSTDVDFNYLAERINVNGGNIRNIVLNAAFLAADEGGAISMRHLIRAIHREFIKIGRLFAEGDFAPYQNLLRSERV